MRKLITVVLVLSALQTIGEWFVNPWHRRRNKVHAYLTQRWPLLGHHCPRPLPLT